MAVHLGLFRGQMIIFGSVILEYCIGLIFLILYESLCTLNTKGTNSTNQVIVGRQYFRIC